MKIDRKQMKDEARLAMREHKPSIYLIVLVFLLIYNVLGVLSIKLSYPGLSLREIYTVDTDALRAAALHRGAVSYVLALAINFMSVVLSFGVYSVCLNVSRRQAAGFGSLFDAFGFFFKALWLNVVMGFFIFLWSMLLVVPGIVAAYRYSMAPYVLLEDPGKSVMNCIRESKRLTAGHKGELFVMNLSFLGWALLSVIPFVSLYTIPYMEVTMANYYNVLSGYQPTALPEPETPQNDSWWN